MREEDIDKDNERKYNREAEIDEDREKTEERGRGG